MAATSDNRSRVRGWVTGGAIVVAVLVVAALVFTNSRSAGNTLDEAAALHAADMTLAAQDVALKSIGHVVLLGQDLELGVANQEAVDAAAIEAERSLATIQDRAAELNEEVGAELAPSLDVFTDSAVQVIEAATSGEAASASELIVSAVVPVAQEVADTLTAERDLRAQAVDDAQRRVGTVAQLAGFLAAFLLPLGAMLAYRQSVRRQLVVAEAQLDARLEAERSVGRAKDQFIANISHELRTPLTSIYGFSEVLLDQGFVDPEMAGDLVGLINTESAELARMVEDLLVAAHDEDAPLAIESAPVDIAAEIDAVANPFRRRGVLIGGTHAEAKVFGDQLRIRQILRNLVANAVQHGGDTIWIYGDVAGSSYVVAVEDDGPGVPDQLVPRLFSRFVHQGDTPLTAGSVGLGLAVAHLLAEAMRGSLDYARMAGRTSFVLTLPLVGSADRSAPADGELTATTG